MEDQDKTSSFRRKPVSTHQSMCNYVDINPRNYDSERYDLQPGLQCQGDLIDETDSDYRSGRSSGVNSRSPDGRPQKARSSPTASEDEKEYSDSENVRLCSGGARFDNSESTSGHVSPSGSAVSEDEECTENSEKFSFRNLTRNQKVIFASTNLANLLSFLSLSILAPFFPKEANQKGVNDTVSGWIFGVFSLTQFIVSPLFGKMVPVIGTKFMFISGLFMCGGCTLLFGFLDLISTEESCTLFVIFCFLVRICLALGCTSLNTSGFVLLVRTFPNDVGTVFGIGEIFTGVGMVTGPALGGFLYGFGGFFLPFAVIGGCCLSSLPLIWYFLPKQDDNVASEEKTINVWNLLRSPKAVVNSLAVIVAASIWSILDPTLEPHLRVFRLKPQVVGILFLIMAAVYAITSPFWGWLADKVSDNRSLLIPGYIVAAAGLLMLGPSQILGFSEAFNSLWMNIVSLVILGASSSLCLIPTYDLYITVLFELGYSEDTGTLGVVSGLWVAMFALGDFAGPSVGGFLIDEVGFDWLCTYVALACCATSFIIIVSWTIEARCCRRTHTTTKASIEEDSLPGERTPLLISGLEGVNSDLMTTYPPKTPGSI